MLTIHFSALGDLRESARDGWRVSESVGRALHCVCSTAVRELLQVGLLRLVYTSEQFVYTSGCRGWWGAKVLIVL